MKITNDQLLQIILKKELVELFMEEENKKLKEEIKKLEKEKEEIQKTLKSKVEGAK